MRRIRRVILSIVAALFLHGAAHANTQADLIEVLRQYQLSLGNKADHLLVSNVRVAGNWSVARCNDGNEYLFKREQTWAVVGQSLPSLTPDFLAHYKVAKVWWDRLLTPAWIQTCKQPLAAIHTKLNGTWVPTLRVEGQYAWGMASTRDTSSDVLLTNRSGAWQVLRVGAGGPFTRDMLKQANVPPAIWGRLVPNLVR